MVVRRAFMGVPPKKPRTASVSSVSTAKDEGHDYSGLLAGVQESFELVSSWPGPFFLTDVTGLPKLYLDSMPSARQHHNCSACRRFLEQFGGLVTVTKSGALESVFWKIGGRVPVFYLPVFEAMREAVEDARIVSPFLCKDFIWGTPKTGNWLHMAAVPASNRVYTERALTPGQMMAAHKERFRIVNDALHEFTPAMLDQALRLFEADALAGSEKFVGPVKWLRDLHDRPKGRKGENLLWAAVAMAPEGYCHPKSSVVAPLLQDIVNGLPFEDIKRKFNAKMAPLQYQRPQAAPTAGNIEASEKLVERLGIRRSFERRFARLDELETIWTPYAPTSKAAAAPGALFGGVKPKATRAQSLVPPVSMPARTMTWEKFKELILPGAEQIEVDVPHSGNFIAFTSAVHADAPPLFKWDSPVAWYVYPGGSSANRWGLYPGWVQVTAIAPLPTMWGKEPKPHLGEGDVLMLQGAVDRQNSGSALFPECLRGDLHGARATIEAYSRSAKLSGADRASACGYDMRKSHARGKLRVLASGALTSYFIDRWE